MGYFSNGSEGEFYESAICGRCVHYRDNPDEDQCPVWTIHLLFNYDQHDNATVKDMMDGLIPRSDVPGYNDLCNMFHPAKEEWASHGKDYQEWLGKHKKATQVTS